MKATVMNDEKLKPCPFCGETPSVIDGIDRGSQEEYQGYGCIICENDLCAITPSCDYYNGLNQGIFGWNRRADLANPEKVDEKLDAALLNADWGQVIANGGPPCFHLDGDKLCFRAKRWPGHDGGSMHQYVSLHEFVMGRGLLSGVARENKS